jgi:hypothetical protein
MSKLQEFLDVLTDRELVNFHTYRYVQFLKGSREKIDAELRKRGITQADFARITAEAPPSRGNVCPRCGSEKFYNSTEIETVTYQYASVDFEVDYRTCLVCLYCAEKETGSNARSFTGPFGFIQALMNRKK